MFPASLLSLVPVLSARGLYCCTLQNIRLSLYPGIITGIYDPNNHDGDILCRALAKEIPVSSGTLLFRQKSFKNLFFKKKICYLPSSFPVSAIFDPLSVFENVYLFRKFSPFFLTPGSKRFLRDLLKNILGISPNKPLLPPMFWTPKVFH